MKHRYTTTTVKEPMFPPSLKWIINRISSIEWELKNKELKVDHTLKNDLKNVIRDLNETVNELFIKK